ncbi:MAG: uracil phosphoribosyltransferase [Bacteroidales bacterium]|jgi:uracil phosphoribosyltransferase|nr:uracil phosphoribosyltransferase [Bacteroidales bacterium]
MINLETQNSIFNQFVSELRDEKIQKDRMRFRKNLHRIGEIFAYEISKTFNYSSKQVTTPLGIKEMQLCDDKVVICSILRAALPLHEGLLDYFDCADNGFISAYRKTDKSGGFTVRMEYLACPDMNDCTLILCDPMLATGTSLVKAYQALLELGTPKHTHLVSVVSSTLAIEYVEKHIPQKDVKLWVGAIDEELTSQSYIVPGLGDAGDLAFGVKLPN